MNIKISNIKTMSAHTMKGLRIGTIGLLLISLVGFLPVNVHAQSSSSRPKTTRKIRWKPPKPPSSLGTPTGTEQGAGQRTDCKQYENVRALVPKIKNNTHWGQTTSDQPTIWLTAPQGLEENLLMEITVREGKKPIAKQLFTAPKTSAGVFSVPFPDKISLQPDRTYRWDVVIYCDSESGTEDKPLTVQGQIQRVLSPKKLPQAPLERATMLAEQGIWYDALSQLGNAIRIAPSENLMTAWSDLLQSAELEAGRDPVNTPIQNCCQLLVPQEQQK